jgi:hypothetical protein
MSEFKGISSHRSKQPTTTDKAKQQQKQQTAVGESKQTIATGKPKQQQQQQAAVSESKQPITTDKAKQQQQQQTAVGESKQPITTDKAKQQQQQQTAVGESKQPTTTDESKLAEEVTLETKPSFYSNLKRYYLHFYRLFLSTNDSKRFVWVRFPQIVRWALNNRLLFFIITE